MVAATRCKSVYERWVRHESAGVWVAYIAIPKSSCLAAGPWKFHEFTSKEVYC